MSITRLDPNVIFLGGDRTQINDVACSIAITPGMLVERFNNAGITRWRPATTNGLAGPAAVATDHAMANKGVNDVYNINDLVEVSILHKGATAWMFLASGSGNVVYGDFLGDNGSSTAGTLKLSPTVPRFVALEAKSNINTLTRIRVEAI
jgi:hypothetical protein